MEVAMVEPVLSSHHSLIHPYMAQMDYMIPALYRFVYLVYKGFFLFLQLL